MLASVLWANPAWWALHGAPEEPPLRLSAFALVLACCARAGLLLAPILVRPGLSHLASPALIACAPQRGANRKHAGIL